MASLIAKGKQYVLRARHLYVSLVAKVGHCFALATFYSFWQYSCFTLKLINLTDAMLVVAKDTWH